MLKSWGYKVAEITSGRNVKPYVDKKSIRTFDNKQGGYFWHRDPEDRQLKVLSGDGWQFQFDGCLPLLLREGMELDVPYGVYHRLIKGTTDLNVEITKMAQPDNNNRLDRIEDKLDRLSDAVVSLARAEEKIAAIMVSVQAQNETLIGLGRRIDSVEENTTKNTTNISTISKMCWILFAAAVGTISTMLLNHQI
jgi:hypothetical protein